MQYQIVTGMGRLGFGTLSAVFLWIFWEIAHDFLSFNIGNRLRSWANAFFNHQLPTYICQFAVCLRNCTACSIALLAQLHCSGDYFGPPPMTLPDFQYKKHSVDGLTHE